LPLPRGLCLEHTLEPVRGLGEPQAFLLLGALVLGGNLFLHAWRRDKVVGAGLSWCLLALAPFLNILPFLNVSLVADRYLYLASAGFLLAAVRLLSFLDVRPRVLAWSWGLLACLYGAMAFSHLDRFSDDWTLWKATALCAPDNPRARLPLAVHYMRRLMYPEAVAEYQKVLELAPGLLPRVYLDFGVCLAEAGRLNDAINLTRAQLAQEETPEGLNNLGMFYLRAGRAREASKALEIAVLLDPGSSGVRLNLGAAYLALGRRAEAAEELERAARDPAVRPKALRLQAELRLRRGDKAGAAALYEESLRLDPMQWDAAKGLSRLYTRLGERRKGAVVVAAFRGRIEALLGVLRKRDRDEDAPALAYAEGLRLKALEEGGTRPKARTSSGRRRAPRSRAGGRIP
jgi:tetratricopeptide (TPR) repeat protein